MLQPREELLLPIVQAPSEPLVRHEHGTHHLLFLLGSLTLVWCSWEYHVLVQVTHEVVTRSALQLTRTTLARVQPGNMV